MEFAKSSLLLREVNSRVLMQLAEQDSRIVLLDADLMNASAFSSICGPISQPDFQLRNRGKQYDRRCGRAFRRGDDSGCAFLCLFRIAPCSRSNFHVRRLCRAEYKNHRHRPRRLQHRKRRFAYGAGGYRHPAFARRNNDRRSTDETMLRSILPQIIQAPGVSYIRLYRKTNLKIYPDGPPSPWEKRIPSGWAALSPSSRRVP